MQQKKQLKKYKIAKMRKNTMTKTMLRNKLKSLQSLPKGLKKNVDMGFVDEYSDDKIHDICEACYNIVHKKLPLNIKNFH